MVSRVGISMLMIGLARVDAGAQTTPPRTLTFTVPASPGAQALQNHDLRWITTGNDFDQSALDSIAIDAEIGRRLRAYDAATPIVTYDVPINSGRLSRPTHQKYVEFDPRIGTLAVSNSGRPLDREAYFWRYGDVHIAVPGDTHRDQLNVYAVARALEILRYRYPDAYQRLFVDVRGFPADSPTFEKHRRRFSTLLFSFDESPTYVAAGATGLGAIATPAGSTIAASSNIAVVSIDNTTIQGSSPNGSQPIYQRSADENYVRYLREGLVESLVHEMLHRYVDHRSSFDAVYNELHRYRNGGIFEVEEAIVASTSLGYFSRAGGLQSDISYYYNDTLRSNIRTMMSRTLAERFARLVNPGLTGSGYMQRLRLPVLN